MSQIIEVKVPDIGDFKGVAVIEVMVKAGDAVEPEQSLLTMETDKATMDVPSPAAGVVQEVKVKAGDKVSEGSVILLLESSAQIPPSPPLLRKGRCVTAGHPPAYPLRVQRGGQSACQLPNPLRRHPSPTRSIFR